MKQSGKRTRNAASQTATTFTPCGPPLILTGLFGCIGRHAGFFQTAVLSFENEVFMLLYSCLVPYMNSYALVGGLRSCRGEGEEVFSF